MGQLLIFNPDDRPASLVLTFFYEDRAPENVPINVPARTTRETNDNHRPIKPGERAAIKVDSTLPVIAQATIGWTNTANEYSPGAKTQSTRGVRETAKCYFAVGEPARVELALHFQGSVVRHTVAVPALRLRRVAINPLARPNTNYDTAFTSDVPVVVHWRRAVFWYDSDEVMAFWSAPAMPLAEPR